MVSPEKKYNFVILWWSVKGQVPFLGTDCSAPYSSAMLCFRDPFVFTVLLTEDCRDSVVIHFKTNQPSLEVLRGPPHQEPQPQSRLVVSSQLFTVFRGWSLSQHRNAFFGLIGRKVRASIMT